MNIYLGPCRLLQVTLKVKTTNASPTDSQTTKKPQTNFEIAAKAWRELQQMPATNRSAAEQLKCLTINREDLFQKDSIAFC